MNKFKIGLQLYSVKDEMAKDFYGTLEKVKNMGYDYVEFAGYFGKSAEEIREMLETLKLKCISVHQAYEVFLNKLEKEINFIKILGAKYVAIPWMSPENHAGNAVFLQRVEEITQTGKLLKENGIQLLYHNHDFEFEKFNGEYKLDILYSEICAKYLECEIDTCWVTYAGVNAPDYLIKYSDRCPVVHLKDFVCGNAEKGAVYALIDSSGKEIDKNKQTNGFKFKPLGQGVQDFESILKAAEKAGSEYLIVEQDSSLEMPPLEASELSRKYLKTLGV